MATATGAAPTTNRTPPSTIISTTLAATVTEAVAVAAQLRDHPDVRSLYPGLLRQLHGTVRASVPLLQAAEAEAVRRAGAGDAVAAALVGYYQRHAVEELRHDEWLLADYQATGGDPAEIWADPPSAAVATMVGAIYYWIFHFHPVALLGYLAVTEGAPPNLQLIDDLQQRTGYPIKAFHTLRHHAVIDIDHGDEVWDLIDQLPLTATHLDVINLAANHTIATQITLIRHLLAVSEHG
jgi:hypothetical protein